jgi:hypothetical protein
MKNTIAFNMKNHNFLFISLFILPLIVGSCKREEKPMDGPSLQDLNGQFSMMEPFRCNKTAVDFSKGETAEFTAAFSKLCNWTIRIKGNFSGAEKLISGKSRIIQAGQAIWNGTTTNFPMFRTEPCLATLKIEGVTDSFNLAIGVNGLRKPEGFMIADFETGISSKWSTFIQSGANMDFRVKTDAFVVEGNSYLNMAGTVNWDWLIGMIDFPAAAFGQSHFPLTTVPEDAYFNCLVYGVSNVNESRILFQFREDDNNNGKFDASADDQYDYELRVNWEGWKLISIKYSELVHLVNGSPASNNGNNRHNPNSLVLASMLHLANPSMGGTATKVDCLMFTDKKPLEL